MRTVAVASQKGGCGKTTLALHLAVAAEMAGYATVVIDMDPQGTAEAWSEWRKEAPPPVIPAKAPTLARTLERAVAHGAEFVVIDTPPIAEAEARAAAKVANLVLVPCRPNAFDLHSVKTTAELPALSEKPAFALFNAGPVSAPKLYLETAELITAFGLKVAPCRLSDRATFRHATGSGQSAQEIEPNGKAALEIQAIWDWLCKQVGMPTRQRVNTTAKVVA